MRRLISCFLALSAFSFTLPPIHADEPALGQELRELRQAVQLQSKQIEFLTDQIGRLTRALEGQKPAEGSVSPAGVEAPKVPADPAPEAPKVELVPRAEPVASAPKHVVAKGETLTSIAKQYNISVAELKNANKIENERKLQIGQILTVPTAKTPETPDKKENP